MRSGTVVDLPPSIAFRLQLSNERTSLLFGLGYFLLQVLDFWVVIGVTRAKIGQLRLQSIEFLVDPRQTCRSTVSGPGSRMQRPVLLDQCLEIDPLLLRGVESVLFVL